MKHTNLPVDNGLQAAQNLKRKPVFKKIFLKIFNIFLIVSISAYVIFLGINKARQFEIYNQPTVETKVYTIWNVETFEGGSKSRVIYLKNIAREMEKQNPGILFNIQTIAPEKLADQLQEMCPDIISFGFGVGRQVLDKLLTFSSSYDVRPALAKSGSYNGKIYALPYIVSGYAMFSHGEVENCIEYGSSEYIKPQNAIKDANLPLKSTGSQFETYKNFVYHHDHALLGTARDVFRVDNLNKIGRTNAHITPLNNYTDLLQYIARFKTDKIIEQFCSKVLSPTYQCKLTDYGLFSSLDTKLYTSGIYSDMENAIFECKIANVFDA